MSGLAHAYFEVTDDGLLPGPLTASRWSTEMVTGPAVCGALARALEQGHGGDGLQPSRFTVDLFRPIRTTPFTTRTTLVRDGNRIRVADVELVQDGRVAARASLVLLRPSSPPPGEVWSSEHHLDPPPPDLMEDGPPGWGGTAGAWFASDGHPGGWTRSMADHQSATRTRMWAQFPAVVAGEDSSPFVRAAMQAEATSLVTNWGSAGVGYINADLTLALARLPQGVVLGLEADGHLNAAGLAVGTATLFDLLGPIGTCTVVALSNAQRQVDFSAVTDARPPAATT